MINNLNWLFKISYIIKINPNNHHISSSGDFGLGFPIRDCALSPTLLLQQVQNTGRAGVNSPFFVPITVIRQVSYLQDISSCSSLLEDRVYDQMSFENSRLLPQYGWNKERHSMGMYKHNSSQYNKDKRDHHHRDYH